jgi:catechol 2,3-dioxygenase-like lactoylglutathione lyase family enzyme
MNAPANGLLHHVELWVPHLDRAIGSFGWLLESLGYERFQDWKSGRSWRLGPTYVVVEESPAMTGERHDRRAPGLNHLAFHVSGAAEVERLAVEGTARGWTLMFADRHPHAGGKDHYAAYMENEDGFEIELVAMPS